MRISVVCLILACLPASSPADDCWPFTSQPKIALHAKAYNSSKACGSNAPSGLACDEYAGSNLRTDWPLGVRSSVYVVVLDLDPAMGLLGATFGIDFAYDVNTYDGIYINTFTHCAALAFPSTAPAFPREPQSGVVVTFASCQQTVDPSDPQGEATVVLGWFDATGYHVPTPLAITPRLYIAEPDLQYADCLALARDFCYPLTAGILAYGYPGGGFDPCGLIFDAVEPSSWSRLKRGVKRD